MPDVELSAGQRREAGDVSSSGPSSDSDVGEDGGGQRRRGSVSQEGSSGGGDGTAACPAAGVVPLGVVVSKAADAAALKAGVPKSIGGWVGAAPVAASEKDGGSVQTAAAKKGVPRSESYHEECSGYGLEMRHSWEQLSQGLI
ncbi:hypothetical protein Taro_005060 [Colocasia esculenta]|uniref:Uncharacterized protein n=1 Tax=Colocasia esculenta TaxID=4460 RepID=A0A843TTE4_COLES|nr:hypothetical protein [Colocasia esculenta]